MKNIKIIFAMSTELTQAIHEVCSNSKNNPELN